MIQTSSRLSSVSSSEGSHYAQCPAPQTSTGALPLPVEFMFQTLIYLLPYPTDPMRSNTAVCTNWPSALLERSRSKRVVRTERALTGSTNGTFRRMAIQVGIVHRRVGWRLRPTNEHKRAPQVNGQTVTRSVESGDALTLANQGSLLEQRCVCAF